jgi:hypothetical protein
MTPGFVTLTINRTPARRFRSNRLKRITRVVRATNRFGQPRRRQRTVTLVPAGASTDKRVRWAPRAVSRPVIRTIGNGLMKAGDAAGGVNGGFAGGSNLGRGTS